MKHLAAIVLAVAFAVPAMAQHGSGREFVVVRDLGYAQAHPITVLLHWHRQTLELSGVHFEDPTGLVVDSGGRVSVSRRFSVYVDARYTPIETWSHVTFGGTVSSARIGDKPMIVFTGITFRF
ncbi:MAG: hypothetical protein ACXW29_00070 [Thermoanaerobaculia bacterium]